MQFCQQFKKKYIMNNILICGPKYSTKIKIIIFEFVHSLYPTFYSICFGTACGAIEDSGPVYSLS